MTITELIPDIRPVVDLDVDLDSEPGCEFSLCLADHRLPARWVAINWCGCQTLYCDPCIVWFRQYLKERADQPYWCECKMCGAVTLRWVHDAARVVPL